MELLLEQSTENFDCLHPRITLPINGKVQKEQINSEDGLKYAHKSLHICKHKTFPPSVTTEPNVRLRARQMLWGDKLPQRGDVNREESLCATTVDEAGVSTFRGSVLTQLCGS